MLPDFDFDNVDERATNLYVRQGTGKNSEFSTVHIDTRVREILLDALLETMESMRFFGTEATLYDPSNDLGYRDFLYFPLDDELATGARVLTEIGDPPPIQNPLEVLPKINMYMAKFRDLQDRELLAVASVSNFGKYVQNHRFTWVFGNELTVVDRAQFRLESDFDFLIDSSNIFIHRHKTFERICGFSDALVDAMTANLTHVAEQLQFVHFEGISLGLGKSVTAAREVAAIRANRFYENLDAQRLQSGCAKLNIRYEVRDGVMHIDEEDHQKFLFLLSRKFLEIDLRTDGVELYQVAGRRPYAR
jgi:hypothetical protein